MKSNHMKIFTLLASLLMIFALNACDLSGDGKDGTHSLRNLLNEGQPPVANAGIDQSAVAGDTVVLDGSKSYDPDGTIESYVWSFGDDLGNRTGATVTEIIPSDAASGDYVVTLTVTDNDGNTDSDTVTITVEGVEEEPVNTPPVANDKSVNIMCSSTVPEDIELTATDADGDALTYSIVTEPKYGTVTITGNIASYHINDDVDSINAMCEALETDTFTFKVNDGTVDSSPATVSITVVNEAT
ncbi:PKD domain-containing protein [Sulfurovum sp.]|uniref:PKD domain-containing protein n=1 Tax=Sulfurovum sp. TaxID=1969726 RepID=UPI0025E04C47|nr:PKD domain-containing protein [Sulfurovum sp.]